MSGELRQEIYYLSENVGKILLHINSANKRVIRQDGYKLKEQPKISTKLLQDETKNENLSKQNH